MEEKKKNNELTDEEMDAVAGGVKACQIPPRFERVTPESDEPETPVCRRPGN